MNDVPIIAIVDDDASIRRSLLRVVESAGYQGETFASAREFLEWLPRNQAACLVLDVYLAEMSGFDLQERLAVPIVFITAHDDLPTLERIGKSGAAGHLRKPFAASTVLDAIRRSVRATRARTSGVAGDDRVDDAESKDGDRSWPGRTVGPTSNSPPRCAPPDSTADQ
jgi:FixJ family two-component response regulator